MRGLGFALVLAALALGLAFLYAQPYWTVERMRAAADAGDAQALSRHIDYPALRADVRATLEARLAAMAGPDPLGGLGAALAGAALAPLIDAVVSPAGVAALLEGRRPDLEQGRMPPPERRPREDRPEVRMGYESHDRFAVHIRDRVGAELALVLRRIGLTWRLAGLRLPE